VKELVILGQRL